LGFSLGGQMASLRRAEIAIADERRYQILVEGIADYAIFMLDPGGFVSTWNTGAQRFKGYEGAEIIGEHFSRFYTEEDRRAGIPALALETARREGRFEREGWRVRKDGSRFWAHVVIDAIRDERGDLIGFAKITRDLTERKLAQEQLRQAEEQFRILVQGVTDYAIFMLDPAGHVTTWNAGAERIKGYPSADILGQHFSRFYTEEDRAAGMPERVLETTARTGRFDTEGWRIRKDGSRFWAHVVVDAIRDDEGDLIGFAKVTRDNTERRAAQQAVEAFAYSVSHDLRAPLRGIEGFARILLDDFGDALGSPGRRYAERIAAAADRLQVLIADLLTFSRLQRAEIKLCRVDPSRIVHRQVEQVRILAGGEDAIIDIAEPLPSVRAEPTVLEQAFANLLSNAVKFRRRGERAHVRVWGEVRGDRGRLWVEDDGIGIAPEHQERIFGAFERLHGQEAYPGSGMGLAIVKTGIERMSGATGVVSLVGDGAKFWIELPAVNAPNQNEQT
jgi:PAS domain S-box-containing protein